MRRWMLTMAALAGASALVTAPMTADARAAADAGRCPVVDVAASQDGFTAPASVPAGLLTFRVTTTNQDGIVFGLFRLNPGVQLDDFVELLRVALNGEGAEQVEAGQAVASQSTLFGGINTVPGRPVTFTEALRPGSYHLINYTDILAGPDNPVAVRPIVISGQPRLCAPPLPEATIEMIDTPAGPRYRAPAQLEPGAPILVVNRTEHVEEAVLMPILPGFTLADVRQFFEALDGNRPPPFFPFAGTPRGMPVIHPGLVTIIEPNLTAGHYALLTFLPDENGRLRAAHGMLTEVTVG